MSHLTYIDRLYFEESFLEDCAMCCSTYEREKENNHFPQPRTKLVHLTKQYSKVNVTLSTPIILNI